MINPGWIQTTHLLPPTDLWLDLMFDLNLKIMLTVWNVFCSCQDVMGPVSSPRSTEISICLIPQRKPVPTILSPCEHTCLTCLPSGFALCLYPTPKCKLAHIFLRKDTCAVMLFSVLRCATTSPICSWNYEVEGQFSLQCGKDTECTKTRTQAFTCPTFISLWFEIIRMDQFWNNSSGYNAPQRFQDYSPQVVSYSIANPVP